ncbi:MAG: hypothetical protein ACR2JO_01625 [Mycobacteriales bacterium]
MPSLQIKNVPLALHEELRRRARIRGETVRDYVLALIERDQEIPTRQEWLRQVHKLRPVETGPSAVELIEESRSERERQQSGLR